jgi:hypothetical protein
MLRKLLFVAVIGVAPLSSWDGFLFADQPIDVFIIAGQSNAVGADAPAPDLEHQDIDDNILLWWRSGDPPPDKHDSVSDGWQNLQAQPKGDPILPRSHPTRQWGNYTHAEGGFGPEVGFARQVAKQQKTHVAVVKVAFSGTHVEGDWQPEGVQPNEIDWRNSHGACFRSLIQEYGRAVKELEKRGWQPTARALVWVQGESDANAARAPSYEENLAKMLNALRKAIDAPNLVALLGINTQFSHGKNKFVPQIVAAQKRLAAKTNLAIYVDTNGATTANPAHFDAAGTLDVGRRFAKAWLNR